MKRSSKRRKYPDKMTYSELKAAGYHDLAGYVKGKRAASFEPVGSIFRRIPFNEAKHVRSKGCGYLRPEDF